MNDKLQKIREEAERRIAESRNNESLDEIKVAFLGKKGELTQMLKSMKDLSLKKDQRLVRW